MSNPFGTDEMAVGYAHSRPPVHARVIERACRHMKHPAPFERALDVGCGAGVSTKALAGFAGICIGLEPSQSMLKWAPALATAACFVVGGAEALPFAGDSVDLITAAGSLNYVDLELFFLEAARVLRPGGTLLVYDFAAGKSFPGTTILDEWFSRFSNRFPLPANEGRELNPDILAAWNSGFRVDAHELFELAIPLTPEFYLDYVMTETNIAAALRQGASYAEIRGWCEETLAPVWNQTDHEVLFRGYFACMRPYST